MMIVCSESSLSLLRYYKNDIVQKPIAKMLSKNSLYYRTKTPLYSYLYYTLMLDWIIKIPRIEISYVTSDHTSPFKQVYGIYH